MGEDVEGGEGKFGIVVWRRSVMVKKKRVGKKPSPTLSTISEENNNLECELWCEPY